MIYGVPDKRLNTNSLVLGCKNKTAYKAVKKKKNVKKKLMNLISLFRGLFIYVWVQPPASHKLCFFINVIKSNIYFNKQFN